MVMLRTARTGGRSERVVADTLRATLAELGRVGYAGLRIDEVAQRAGVNKTTVYRRWPTKAALVEAALRAWRLPLAVPDTGTVDGDLAALAAETAERSSAPEKRSLARVFHAELEHPEVAAIAGVLRREAQAPWLQVIQRAVARGELPARTDAALIVDLVWGAMMSRLRVNQVVDKGWLGSVVRIVLSGVRASG
jgi:AcrR family transcriptional regulator